MTNTLVELLQESATKYGDRPALFFKPKLRYLRWSYQDLWEQTGWVAAKLASLGAVPGDRILIWGPNCPQWVLAFFGCLRLGCVAVPLDLRSSKDFIADVVQQTRPVAAFVSGQGEEVCRTLSVNPLLFEELREWGDPPTASSWADPVVRPDDLAEIMFTSGTTGNPKGVMLTHGNILANLLASNQYIPGDRSYRLLSILPLSHMFEQMGCLFMALHCGASVTFPASRQPTMLFRIMREQRITTLVLVPQALELFMNGIEAAIERQGKGDRWRFMQQLARHLPAPLRRRIFSAVHRRLGGNLQFITSGGAPLASELGAKWDLLGVKIIQGYGTTEASPVISSHTLRNPRFDSVGLPLPGVNVKIAADGEILVHGPNITCGYWENLEQTDQAFRDGWYLTGDLGYIDAGGYVHVQGRKRDMIVLPNGQNVFPNDIEVALCRHQAVNDAVVVGMPRESGSEVHAVLLMDDAQQAAGAVLLANETLAEHQRIRGFTVWPQEDFPRTHTLKVKKNLVIEALVDEAQGVLVATDLPGTVEPTEAADPVLQLVARLARRSPGEVSPESQLGSDLNLDSLSRVEMLSMIEQELGIYVDESLIDGSTTVAELRELVDRQHGFSGGTLSFYDWPLDRWCVLLRGVLLRLIVFPWLRFLYRARAEGTRHLDGLPRPVIFAINHNSIRWDSLVLLKVLPRIWRRHLAFAAAAELTFGRRWVAILASLVANAFPISRGTAIRQSLERMGWLLDQGWDIGIFPEGIQLLGQDLQPFRSGTGLLAVEGQVKVVPVRLVNHDIRRRRFMGIRLPRRVSVRFGDPLYFPQSTSYEQATQQIERAVREL